MGQRDYSQCNFRCYKSGKQGLQMGQFYGLQIGPKELKITAKGLQIKHLNFRIIFSLLNCFKCYKCYVYSVYNVINEIL